MGIVGDLGQRPMGAEFPGAVGANAPGEKLIWVHPTENNWASH